MATLFDLDFRVSRAATVAFFAGVAALEALRSGFLALFVGLLEAAAFVGEEVSFFAGDFEVIVLAGDFEGDEALAPAFLLATDAFAADLFTTEVALATDALATDALATDALATDALTTEGFETDLFETDRFAMERLATEALATDYFLAEVVAAFLTTSTIACS